MDWTFLLGATAFAASIGGVVWLRTHPPRVDDGRQNDDVVPVAMTAQRTRRVLQTLLRDGGLVAAVLRQRLRMRRFDFYELMDQLERRDLVEHYADEPFRNGYRLTEHGRDEARRDDM